MPFDQQLGEGTDLRVAPELSDSVGPLEVGGHEDMEQLGAGSGSECVEALPELAHGAGLILGSGATDTPSMSYWGWGGGGYVFPIAGWAIDHLLWGDLDDAERSGVRAAIADPVVNEGVRSEALGRRSEKLQAIGSEASFFSGLARIDGEFRSIRVAVTPHDFVLLDNWAHVDPDTELGRLPRESITDAVIVDENGNEVADQLIDPVRELDTPEEERYAVLLKRHGENGELPPVSFLFRSGEPALECRDGYRRFISPRG